MRRSPAGFLGEFALVLMLATQPAFADDFTDVIDEALEAYSDGDLAGARNSLDYARQLLDQKKTSTLKSFFPAPLPGWEVQETRGDRAGAVAMLGGAYAGAHYTDGSQEVEISLIADTPMMQQLDMIMSHPLLGQPGARMIRIQRQNGYVTSDSKVIFLVNNRYLVTFEGNADEDTKIAYAESFDFQGLANAP